MAYLEVGKDWMINIMDMDVKSINMDILMEDDEEPFSTEELEEASRHDLGRTPGQEGDDLAKVIELVAEAESSDMHSEDPDRNNPKLADGPKSFTIMNAKIEESLPYSASAVVGSLESQNDYLGRNFNEIMRQVRSAEADISTPQEVTENELTASKLRIILDEMIWDATSADEVQTVQVIQQNLLQDVAIRQANGSLEDLLMQKDADILDYADENLVHTFNLKENMRTCEVPIIYGNWKIPRAVWANGFLAFVLKLHPNTVIGAASNFFQSLFTKEEVINSTINGKDNTVVLCPNKQKVIYELVGWMKHNYQHPYQDVIYEDKYALDEEEIALIKKKVFIEFKNQLRREYLDIGKKAAKRSAPETVDIDV